MPRGHCTGQIHVSMLSYDDKSFAGNGVYLTDALDVMDNWRQLPDHRLHVRPKGNSTPLDEFGWMCDGAVINGTRGFAMVALAIFSVVGQWQRSVPAEVLDLLTNIKVKYTKHNTTQSRLVASLVDSVINNKVNRSMEDPSFLKNELKRNSQATAHGVKTSLQAYKHRLMANPALHMKQSTEECTLRFLQEDKVCVQTTVIISSTIANSSWQTCAFTAHALMAPRFVITAKLGNWMHDFCDRHLRQTATGQQLATQLAIKETPEGSKITQESFDLLCGVCGFWVCVTENVLPTLGLGESGIKELSEDFVEKGRHGSLRSACGNILLKEPPFFDSWTAMGTWLKKAMASLKAAVEAKVEEANKAANESPAAILQEVEKANISVGIYLGEITLDVNA